MSESPVIDLMTRRDVDDLKQTTRALQQTNAMSEIARARDHRETMAMLERLTVATERVAENTANLPALMEALGRDSNGHGRTNSVDADDRH